MDCSEKDANESQDAQTQLVADLVEQYLARVEADETVDVSTFLKQHPPAVADRVRACLASLQMVRGMSRELDDTEPTNSVEASVPGEIGEFRIIRELGRGGMGIVYEAEQRSLQRRVALKVLPFASLMSRHEIERFNNEARAAAMLKHPQIVSVYSVGCERGLNYYAMELVEGVSLAQVVEDLSSDQVSTPRSTSRLAAFSTHPTSTAGYCDDVARVIARVARAVDFAHQSGVIHRDLKPSNLLLDRFGEVFVADFGLARIETDDRLTLTGDVLGTVRYMSPEQAAGRVCDGRTDVYSLGATMYELLTLNPLVTSKDRQGIVHAVLNDIPIPPRHHNAAVPPELETVVLKAVAKESTDRYQTCAQLADDLERFLERKPVLATRPTYMHRLLRWSQRNQRFAAALGLLVVLLAVLGVVGPIAAVRQTRLANSERELKEQQAALSLRLQQQVYASEMRLAHRAVENGDFAQAIALLLAHTSDGNGNDLRGFEWFYLWERCRQVLAVPTYQWHCGIQQVEVSPDGKHVALGGWDGAVIVRRARDFERVWARQWISPQAASEISLSDASPSAHKASLAGIAFSPDSSLVLSLSIDGEFKVWRASDGELLVDRSVLKSPEEDTAVALAVSRQGTVAYTTTHAGRSELISCALHDGTVHFDNAETIDVSGQAIRAIGFSAEGNLLAVASVNSVQVWDVTKREKRGELIASAVQDMVFSPTREDELAITTASPNSESEKGEVVIWNPKSSTRISMPSYLAGRLAYSGDGQQLAVGSQDGYIRLLDVDSAQENARFRADQSAIFSVRFLPERGLCTCALSGLVRLWSITSLPNPPQAWNVDLSNGQPTVLSTVDGHRVFLSGSTNTRVLDGVTGELIRELTRPGPDGLSVGTLALSPDEGVLAESFAPWRRDGARGLVVHDLRNGSRIEMQGSSGIGRSGCDFSPDGRHIASAQGHDVVIFDVSSGELLQTLPGHRDNVGKVRYVPNSDLLVSMAPGHFREMIIWDLSTDKRARTLIAPPEVAAIDDFAVSNSGKLLACGGRNGTIIIYDLLTGVEKRRIESTMGRAFRLDFSPLDDRIAAGGSAEGIQVWNTQTGDLMLRLETHGSVWGVCFSGDGRTLFAAAPVGGETRVFRWPAADPVDVEGQIGNRRRVEWLTASIIFHESWEPPGDAIPQ